MSAVAQRTTMLATYDPAKVNLLVPTVHFQQVSPWYAARISEVRINPDPNGGEIYKVGSRKGDQGWEDLFSIAKPGLLRIASAGGILWWPPGCKYLALERNYVSHQSVGLVRLPDGTIQPIVATKEIDLTVVEEEERERLVKTVESLIREGGLPKAEQPLYKHRWVKRGNQDVCLLDESERQRYVESHLHSVMIQWRKNKAMRAETGSMLRVIRAAFSIKSQYTRQELMRPFIVPRIDFSPDYSDPQVREVLMRQGQAALAALGGGPVGSTLALPGGFNGSLGPSRPALSAPESETEPDVYEFAPAEEPGLAVQDQAPAAEAAPHPQEEAAPASPPPPPPPPPSPAPAPRPAAEEAPPPPEPPPAQGDLFGQPPPATKRKSGNDILGYCADCGKAITSQNVIDYSMQRWGKTICYPCGQKRKANGGGQGG